VILEFPISSSPLLQSRFLEWEVIVARILILEDDESVARSLKEGLEAVPHEVTVAKNTPEGLKSTKGTVHDIVITDITVPEDDGVDTVFAIRWHLHHYSKLIAISGAGSTSSSDYMDVAKTLGISRVFEKPVDIDAVRNAIEELEANFIAQR
jgi:DNA-binding response OmpR family regulator